MMPGRRDTLVGQACTEIRGAILQGRFAPGTKLVVRPLTDELGLSATPIKAALEALTTEGFVETIPHRGYFVPIFTPQDIRDICALRATFDRLGAELAASQTDRVELARSPDATIRLQRAAVRDDDLSRYADLNTEFHRALLNGSRNGRLIRHAENLYGQIRLLVNTSAGLPGRPKEAIREHAAIARAIRAGDTAAAEQIAVDHACRSKSALLQRLGLAED